MEAKTKWLIAIGSIAVVGITAYATRKYWMPSSNTFKSDVLPVGLTEEEKASRAAKAKVIAVAKVTPLTRVTLKEYAGKIPQE